MFYFNQPFHNQHQVLLNFVEYSLTRSTWPLDRDEVNRSDARQYEE